MQTERYQKLVEFHAVRPKHEVKAIIKVSHFGLETRPGCKLDVAVSGLHKNVVVWHLAKLCGANEGSFHSAVIRRSIAKAKCCMTMDVGCDDAGTVYRGLTMNTGLC